MFSMRVRKSQVQHPGLLLYRLLNGESEREFLFYAARKSLPPFNPNGVKVCRGGGGGVGGRGESEPNAFRARLQKVDADGPSGTGALSRFNNLRERP